MQTVTLLRNQRDSMMLVSNVVTVWNNSGGHF